MLTVRPDSLHPRRRRGFSLLELGVSVVLMVALLSVLIPALSSARGVARLDQCASNLRSIAVALHQYLDTHDGRFPYVAGQPAWQWGGVRFSAAAEEPFIDTSRPLSRVLAPYSVIGQAAHVFCCPADRGITGETEFVGTGHRTACQAFGTSYRANASLFNAHLAGITDEMRGMRRHETNIAPSRLLVMGDPVWYEVYEQTGRNAQWHPLNVDEARSMQSGSEGLTTTGIGNVLFLDGAVRYQAVWPKDRTGPIAIEPVRSAE